MQLKKLLDTDEAYAILDEAVMGTWTAGGCLILAEALKLLTGFNIVCIYNQNRRQVEHYGAGDLKGRIWDGDGVHENADAWMEFQKKHENYSDSFYYSFEHFYEWDERTAPGTIIRNKEASQKLAEYLKSEGVKGF
jgi:hypothetical protein